MAPPESFSGNGEKNNRKDHHDDDDQDHQGNNDSHNKKQQNKVSLLKLFKFADLYDCVLMAIGSVGAIVHGASVPIFFIFFGKLINIIGMAYLFPKEASHKVAKVSINSIIKIVELIKGNISKMNKFSSNFN